MLSEKIRIDDVDRQIIRLLQKQPHLTHTQIAEKVNRSQPTVGMRIKRLEELNLLQFQAGVNLKAADLYIAKVELQTNNPEAILAMVKECPYIINAFKLSGSSNFILLIGASEFKTLDKVVNSHFRYNPVVNSVSMEVITEVANDFIIPFDLNFKKCKCVAETNGVIKKKSRVVQEETIEEVQHAKASAIRI